MGSLWRSELGRGVIVLSVAALAVIPVTSNAVVGSSSAVEPSPVVDRTLAAPFLATPFVDVDHSVSFSAPAGWGQTAHTALNPISNPPDPVLELARFQLQVEDPSLYAQPIPITSALLRDAGAMLSVGLMREGSPVTEYSLDAWMNADTQTVPGFVWFDEEAVYEGLHTLVRTYVSRESQRRLVARAVTDEDDWSTLKPIVRASLASLRADPAGRNAPPPPPPPAPTPVPDPEPVAVALAEENTDNSVQLRSQILTRAAQMLGTPYVWGGNTAGVGMDCSAYVSRAWGVARYTTDSIGQVSHHISKDELRAGDAMNLTIGRDPQRRGHIRIFEAWANEAHTLAWVYEETPPRAVHRVIAYDDRYQPIRLNGLSGLGSAALIPAPGVTVERISSPERTVAPVRTPKPATATPKTTVKPTAKPTPTRTAKPTPTKTVKPTPKPTPVKTAKPTPTPKAPKSSPTVKPSANPTAKPVSAR